MSASTPWRVRVRSWLFTLLEPWRSVAVATALVGALALPAAMLAAGPMFERSAADRITQRLVGELRSIPAGLTVTVRGSFAPDLLDPLSTALDGRFDEIDGLGDPVRLMITEEIEIPDPRDERRSLDIRLFARPGALDRLDVLEGAPGAAGAWLPERLADLLDAGPGDVVEIAGPIEVAGVYRDLWAAPLDDYWLEVQPQYRPRLLRLFDEPDFEMVVVTPDDLQARGGGGRVVWEVPLVGSPDTFAALDRTTDAYRSIERDLVRETPLAQLYRDMGSNPEDPPTTFTALHDAEDRARSVTAGLEDPVRAVTFAGGVAGVALSAMGAVFMIRRRRREYRLRAADGDQWWRFFGRAVAQYALPSMAGVGLGVTLAHVAVDAIGPSGRASLGAVEWRSIVVATAASCVLAGLVTAVIATRLTDAMSAEVGGFRASWLLLPIGLTAAMWVQVGQVPDGGLGPLAVAFPLVGVVTGVATAVVGARALVGLSRRAGRRLPLAGFLAWRALAATATGGVLLTGALGLATGLSVVSLTFVGSVDDAVTAKSATIAGAPTKVEIIGPVDGDVLPAATTVVRVSDRRVGDSLARFVGLDPATFASAVDFPAAFGIDEDELLALLDADAASSVPVAVVSGRSVPVSGEFGFDVLFPYRVVGEIGSVPLASDTYPTLVMRTDTFEAFARQRFAAGAGLDDPPAFESPLGSFGRVILSQAESDEVLAALESVGLRVRETTTLEGTAGSVDTSVVRWAFDYLRVLSVIAVVTALGALALYLSERRADRALERVITRQMGVSAGTNVLATVIELTALAVVAIVSGTAAAWITARRVFPSFEPDRTCRR
ncbi:MAG: hypothetical protein ACLGHQ_07310 [Acidimicrobiia bacterium]